MGAEFWRHTMLVKQSNSFSRKHRIYLSGPVFAKQSESKPGLLQNLGTDTGTRVLYKTPVRDISDLKQHLIDTRANM